ncbi:hypothetical protein K439DRAFT_1514287 [Ramaria rubella]|nr:hypothetical protein K439DRAFT_1514287 [Ramaria rubella]
MLDDWLREMLPIAFENIKAIPGVFEDEYPWRLLRTSWSHLELHGEKPDGYDVMSAKGKSKGWKDSKLFFDTLAGHSHKGKGKSVVQKRAVTQGNSNDEVTAKYSTRSKKRKLAAKSTPSEVGEKMVMKPPFPTKLQWILMKLNLFQHPPWRPNSKILKLP